MNDFSTAGSIAAILGFILTGWASFRRLPLVQVLVNPTISDNLGDIREVDWRVDRTTVRGILKDFEKFENAPYGADPQLALSVRLTVRGNSAITLETVEFFDVRKNRVLYQRKAAGTERVKVIPGLNFAEWMFYLGDLDEQSEGLFSLDPSALRLRLRFATGSGRKIRKFRLIPHEGLANVITLFKQETAARER